MNRVLVAGGAGFLGAHLCTRLLDHGDEVLCVDNFSTGRRANVADLLGNPRFELLRHDVTFPLYVEVDRIYNLACPASPVHYQRDPVQTLKTCVHGTINLLGLAKRTGAFFLQASTSEVYGDPEVHPQPESYLGRVNPLGPRACYDEGKRCAETLCADYHRQHGVVVRIARIFNTYGPGMAVGDGRVVSNLITRALSGEPLLVYGTGSQTRSFCYVDDLIDGLIRLMEISRDSGLGPVNLGSERELTIWELAELIRELTGTAVEIRSGDLPADDPGRRRPDLRLARALLGWEPLVDLEEGLARTIAFFRRSRIERAARNPDGPPAKSRTAP